MNEFLLKNETWVVTDGRIGMLNQGRGLAEAVGMPVETKTVHPIFPWTWLPVTSWPAPFLSLGAGSDRFDPPWPKLIIGCGWRSIPFVIEVKRRTQGKTFAVQLQHPKVPSEIFDLVVPPEHDQLSGPNVASIIGSPNGITKEKLSAAHLQWNAEFGTRKTPRIAVLIGGTSKSHRFDEDAARTLASRLNALQNSGCSLLITTSRRTGEAQTRVLKESVNPQSAYFWDGTDPNPYLGMLAHADAIIVTSDSTNMMVEAAATGKPVHIVQLPCTNPKFERLTNRLKELGIARNFSGAIENWTYQPLNETARVAELIRGKLSKS